MIDRLSQLLLRLRIAIWVTVLTLATTLTLFVPPITFDQTIEGFFPSDNPALASYQKSKKSFGGDQLVFVAYDDPQLWTNAGMRRLRSLADELETQVPGLERVDALDQMPVPRKVDEAVSALADGSVSILNLFRIAGGRVTVAMLVKSAGKDPGKQNAIKSELCAHPLFNGLMVDSQGRSTALVVKLGDPAKSNHRDSVAAIRKTADAFASREKLGQIAVAGPPVLIVDGFDSLENDNRSLGIVAMLLMSVTMLIGVRSLSWAILPLVAGWTTWEVTKAFLVYFDLHLSLSSGPIVAQTIVLCMPSASHLAVRFQEKVRTIPDRRRAARSALVSVFVPVLWCAMTAASGYLAMWAATSVAPVAQFGLTMFVCNLLAGLLVWILAPGAMCFTFRRRPPVAADSDAPDTATRPQDVSGHVGAMTDWVIARPGLTLGLFVLPIVLAAVGISRLEFESNYINVYRPWARVARDYHFVEDRMGGIGLVELVFPAPESMTPEWLGNLAKTASELNDVDPQLVTSVISLSDILSVPPNAGENGQRIIDLKVRMLSLPKYSHFLDNFWDREGQRARILVRIRESAQADRKERCFTSMLAKVKQEQSPEAFITGLSHLMTQITHAVVWTSFASGAWSAGISVLMLWVALRSLKLALLAFSPTFLAVSLVLGVMGWIGLKIDMSTVFVASVAIGLSVDDAFHCLLRWKKDVRAGEPTLNGLRHAYAGSGPGVVLSSAAVSLGFLALLFSEFIPMFHFGWLISVATLGGSLGNLLVIPAVLALAARVTRPAEHK